ncbi:MAG: M55 family metallopeptidase [bacterium]|nr:M55 family metallopeptidase [bacterium]
MKVFISVDIEGVCGVVNNDSTSVGGKTYDDARHQMTAEVNAAVLGAFAAGATKVVVNDSHGGMNNIFPRDIHPDALVILGSPKPLMMMEGLDHDCDAIILIGYHAKMHSPGILSHTISGGAVSRVWINGLEVGEIGINAGLAGHYNAPVVMVSGDNYATKEAQALLGAIEVAEVKVAHTRYSAMNIHPNKALTLIQEKALLGVRNRQSAAPLVFESPITVRLELLNAGQADAAAMLPLSKRIDGRTVDYMADDYLTAFQGLRTMISLAGK